MIKDIRRRLTGIITAMGLCAGSSHAASLTAEALIEPVKTQQGVVRLTSSSDLPLNSSLFGFVDFYGRSSDNFYSEVDITKKIAEDKDAGSVGIKLEWNGGTAMDDIIRLGASYTLPEVIEGSFIAVKLHPLNATTAGRIAREIQVSAFASIPLPGRMYIENWTDLNMNYETKSTSIISETTAGLKLTDRLSLEAQAAYNVYSAGWLPRVGIRAEF